MSKVLVIAAHPDDEILGVGATVARHVANGDVAYALILGQGQLSRDNIADTNEVLEKLQNDARKSANIIGFKDIYFESFPDNQFDTVSNLSIVKAVEKYIGQIKPNIIYTHHYGDLNVDHRITHNAVMTATRPFVSDVNEIYSFETLSATECNFDYDYSSFKPNYFVDIGKWIDKKIEALKCYKTEMKDFPYPRSIENIEYTAKKWGSLCGTHFAEAFEVLRVIER